MKLPEDPEDPAAAAALHVAKQLRIIDAANEATSTPPPPAG